MDYRLLNACLTGDLATVQRLVTSVHAENVDLNTKRGVLHFSPLHYACSGGHCDVVQYLIDKAGCDPLSKSQQGKTPLHLTCETGHLNTVRLLMQTYHCEPDCRDQKGQTPLHLASRAAIAQYLVENHGCVPKAHTDNVGRNPLHTAVAMNHLDTASYLLAEGHCDPNVPDNAGDVPLSLTDKPSVIGKLLAHGADPAFLNKTYKKYLPKPPTAISLPVKLVIVGSVSSGKTSLTRALKKETLGKSDLSSGGSTTALGGGVRLVQSWDPATAGIAHHAFVNKQFGCVTLYDFAGHSDYHAVQAAFLRNAICTLPPVFVIVTDLSSGKEVVENDVFYWLSFLSNTFSLPSGKAHVIVIGSHGDTVKAQGVEPCEWLDLESLRRTHPSHALLNLTEFIPMDCRKASSSGLDLLCQALKVACEEVRALFKPHHYYYTHCFWLWLSNAFEDSTMAITVGMLKGQLRADKVLAREKMELFELMKGHHSSEEKRSNYLVSILPESEEDLCDLCVELNDQGHIFFYHDSANAHNSCIVFHQRSFLEDVIGTIFAPCGYRQHRYLATPMGIITVEQFAHELEAYPTEMLVRILTGMECCLQMVHSKNPFTSDQPGQDPPTTSNGGSLFFPGLVTVEDPGTVWCEHSNHLTCYAGWTLHCSDAKQPFTPLFLHALVLRIILTILFASEASPQGGNSSKLSFLQSTCSVWKRGIFWVDTRGVKCLVELSPSHTQLVVLVASHPDASIHMARTLSSLIQAVLKAKEDHSSLTLADEFFLHPSDAKYHPVRADPSLYPIQDVAKAIIGVDGVSFSHRGDAVELKDIIPFEPYYGLGLAIITRIFDYPSSCLSVSPDVSSKIAGCVPVDGACLSSYENLRARLNQFSVFAGRDPLVSVGVYGMRVGQWNVNCDGIHHT